MEDIATMQLALPAGVGAALGAGKSVSFEFYAKNLKFFKKTVSHVGKVCYNISSQLTPLGGKSC
jgi:hypothetical protein